MESDRRAIDRTKDGYRQEGISKKSKTNETRALNQEDASERLIKWKGDSKRVETLKNHRTRQGMHAQSEFKMDAFPDHGDVTLTQWRGRQERKRGRMWRQTRRKRWILPCTGRGLTSYQNCHGWREEHAGEAMGCAGWDLGTKFNGRKTKLIARLRRNVTINKIKP